MSIRSSFGAPQSNVHDPFSLDDRDPFKDFHLESALPKETVTFVNVRTEWKDNPDADILKADLPGLRKDEVRVQVEGNVLKISGERNVEREEKKDKWHCIQRSSGKFLRVYRLPENVKVDEVKGSMKDGMLTVTVPKREVKKPFVKIIEITGLE